MHPAKYKAHLTGLWRRLTREQSQKNSFDSAFESALVEFHDSAVGVESVETEPQQFVGDKSRTSKLKNTWKHNGRSRRCHGKRLKALRRRREVMAESQRAYYITSAVKFWFLEQCLEMSECQNQCLRDALRNVGIKVPYSKGNGYWCQKDGNPLLERRGKQLVAVPLPDRSMGGKFILHCMNHFMGLRLYDDEAILYVDRNLSMSLDNLELFKGVQGLSFFHICSSDWGAVSTKGACERCGGEILGTPVQQDCCGPLHFGCIDVSRCWERYYPDDCFGCAGDASVLLEAIGVRPNIKQLVKELLELQGATSHAVWPNQRKILLCTRDCSVSGKTMRAQ